MVAGAPRSAQAIAELVGRDREAAAFVAGPVDGALRDGDDSIRVLPFDAAPTPGGDRPESG